MPSHVSHERKYLIVAFVALLGLITLSRFPFPDDGVLDPSGGGSAVGWHLSRGEEFRFDEYVVNISDKTLVLHPLTFPLGLAPSLQLRHEVSEGSLSNPHRLRCQSRTNFVSIFVVWP